MDKETYAKHLKRLGFGADFEGSKNCAMVCGYSERTGARWWINGPPAPVAALLKIARDHRHLSTLIRNA
jgi:hypothetical protein